METLKVKIGWLSETLIVSTIIFQLASNPLFTKWKQSGNGKAEARYNSNLLLSIKLKNDEWDVYCQHVGLVH